MKNKILLLIALMMPSSIVFANNWYFEGGAGFINFDDSVDEISPTNLFIGGGYKFSKYFKVGLESSITVSPDQIPTAPQVDFEVNIATIYFRAGTPLSKGTWLYAQLGSSNTELTSSVGSTTVAADDRDTMMGLGLEIGEKDKYLLLSYSIYNNNNNIDVTGFNIGFGIRF